MANEPPESLEPVPAIASRPTASVRSMVAIVSSAICIQLAAWLALWELFGNLGLGYRFFDLSDVVHTYQTYALNLAHGMVVYRDFFMEYPPLFVPLLLVGGNPRSASWFDVRFALFMIVCMIAAGAVTAVAAADGTSTRRPYVVGAVFAGFVFLLGPISANRYDASVALVLAIALLFMMRGRWELAGVVIGLGFALKITPAMLLPIVLMLAPIRRAKRALVGFAAAAVVPFLWVLTLGGSAGAALWQMLGYHLSRPLEVESVLALPIWIGRLAGIPVAVGNAAGSQVLQSGLANALAGVSPLALAGALGVSFWLVWRRRAAICAEPRLIALASLATLLGSLAGSKVLSPQYFVWIIPALAIVAVDRKLLGVVLGTALVLTQVLFPANYWAFVFAQQPTQVLLVIARNLLVLVALGIALWALWRIPDRPQAATWADRREHAERTRTLGRGPYGCCLPALTRFETYRRPSPLGALASADAEYTTRRLSAPRRGTALLWECRRCECSHASLCRRSGSTSRRRAMETIDRTVFASLASHRGWPAVSLYLPTHRAGAEKEQDPLRLKNLVASAYASLVDDGLRPPEAEALLGKASALLEDLAFWREVGDGMAVFIEPAETRVYRVDTVLPEQSVVGSRFYLRPLALAYRGNETFFALAFDRNRARLFSGDRSAITELPLDPAVASFAESSKYDEREESLQFTTHASPESIAGAGAPIGQFHGHGGENVDKGELERFAAGLEKAVAGIVGPENTVPLVLLGVDYQLVAYRSVNTYHHVVAEQVLGATDELTDKTVHSKALGALASQFADAVDADLAELREKPSALVSTDPAEIVSAAASGRVKTLFFDEATGPFGLFDRELFAVSSVCSAAPRYLRESADSEAADAECGWDLVDLAAAETVLHGGAIHAFTGEDAPVSGVAAVLRY